MIQLFQWSSRIYFASFPRATSRSLCAGWTANLNGPSAIQRSRTNQEPGRLLARNGTNSKTWRIRQANLSLHHVAFWTEISLAPDRKTRGDCWVDRYVVQSFCCGVWDGSGTGAWRIWKYMPQCYLWNSELIRSWVNIQNFPTIVHCVPVGDVGSGRVNLTDETPHCAIVICTCQVLWINCLRHGLSQKETELCHRWWWFLVKCSGQTVTIFLTLYDIRLPQHVPLSCILS